jgi:glutamyl-tRNA reductase
VDATLVIIGLNFRTSPVSVRERFWMPEAQRSEALQELIRSEGIDEVMVLATCNRTEFIFWASDPTEGANSVLRFLTHKFNLKLSEWSNFYRLVDDTALLHLFRVATGLDSIVTGESEITSHVLEAWDLAKKAGTTGRFLDAVLQKTMTVSRRARTETGISAASVSIPYATVALSNEIFGSLAERSVLLIGAGKMSELAASYLLNAGARRLTIIDRTLEKAQDLAARLGGRAVAFSQLLTEVCEADIIVSSTSSPKYVLNRSDLDVLLPGRQNLPIVIIDVAVPRDVEPTVRNLTGIYLYDMDDLERVVHQNTSERQVANDAAEKILLQELQGFRQRLVSEQVVPTIVALRHRLEEICGQELSSLESQYGPFTEDQQQALHSLASHITQRIAGSMARELKEMPEQAEQEQLTEAVQKLFHLPTARRTPTVQSN